METALTNELLKPFRFGDLVNPAAIRLRLRGHDKETVIAELVETLALSGAFSESLAPDVYDLVLDRKRLATTGIGAGIAIPHARVHGIEGVQLAIGLSERGIDFNSLDGLPAHVVMLVVSADDQGESHLQTLQMASEFLNEEKNMRSLLASDCVTDILSLVNGQEDH